jgi:hypothetical protein
MHAGKGQRGALTQKFDRLLAMRVTIHCIHVMT